MCRNIRTLHNFDPPTTKDEMHAAALQYVRKVSGMQKPPQAEQFAFERSVTDPAGAGGGAGSTAQTTSVTGAGGAGTGGTGAGGTGQGGAGGTRACGARLGDTCRQDEYCDFPDDQCGAADGTGVCRARPQ